MALEDLTGSNKFIDDLVVTNPVGSTDTKSTLDDHIRGIKNVLKNQFPNLIESMSCTAAELNKLDGLVTTAAELTFVNGVTSNIQAQFSALTAALALKAAIADPSFTGTVNLEALVSSGTITAGDELRLNKGYYETAVSLGTGGSITCDLSLGTYFYTDVLTSIPTFTFSNPATSGKVSSFVLELNNASAYPPVYPASVVWSRGLAPNRSGGKDIISFVTRDGGLTWLGFSGGVQFS